jgi:dethiobiotin synthetase
MVHHIPAILVVRHYLGSIHHTLSSIEALQKRDIRLYGLIVNGPRDQESEDFIRSYTRTEVLAHLPWIEPLTQHTIAAHASILKDQLKTTLSKWLV